ncbi:MAG: SDR family NAD(P)-dependent oxidoreductase [Pseudomonadota bacterium]|nr:SDR family NAD(P)-dependent oxidoreductase [Pseudomonadota bacterium]
MNKTLALDGRVAIVTGGARGIGAAISEKLLAAGASVIIADSGVDIAGKNADPSIALTFVAGLGERAVSYTDDMGDPEAAKQAVQMAMDTFGGVDIIVNNAAILRDAFVFKGDPEDWDAVIRNNLSGPFYLVAAATKVMRDQARNGRGEDKGYAWGRLVHLVSTAGFIGNYGQAPYSAAKGGLISLMRTAALDMARTGVTSNAVAPFAGTRVTEIIKPANDEQTTYKERALKVQPSHVANFVAWLCSGDAQDVTGQIFGVRARETMLFSQARAIVTAVADGEEWLPNELTETVNSKFRNHFADMHTDLEIFNTDPAI